MSEPFLPDATRVAPEGILTTDDLKSPAVLKAMVHFWMKLSSRHCAERDEARAELEAARYNLGRLQKELNAFKAENARLRDEKAYGPRLYRYGKEGE